MQSTNDFNEKLEQQDKLASIGVLTVGIAHEINNPINFIINNINSLENDVNDVINILQMYLSLHDSKDVSTELKKIKERVEEADIDYILPEIHRLIKGIKEGGQRTGEIVKDLRTFTRLDEAYAKKTNIQDSLDSTLTLLQHIVKNRIEIVKDYKPIPEVECYPGKIKQVFMNLLTNAAQAIHDKGTITIKTEKIDDNHIRISIKDTGGGIKKENLAKIFEAFFTTKDADKGTGLGLSISHSIIAAHNGTIEVSSEEGVGTEFIITLPINQK